jgi:ribulose-5-phosphate 4-epimerase/fuculose-1-phosphate aldolase
MASIALSDVGAAKARGISDAEWDTRVQLAAAFRVAYHLGWNDRITNHITAKVPQTDNAFLMNPHGLGWHEVTASNLVKANFDGKILSDTEFGLAPAGLNFHSAILKANPDVACVIHTHTTAGVVVSALKSGLMILDQTGCHLHGEVAYHEFEGYAQEKDEAVRIIAELGNKKTMIMWNHGLLAVGRTIGEAFAYMRKLIDACDLQVRLMSTGGEIRSVPEQALAFMGQQIAAKRGNKPYGDLEWQMYLRLAEQLDPSFRT